MNNYNELISLKYNAPSAAFEVVWLPDPTQVAPGHFDPESGLFIPPDNSQVPLIPVITYWTLPDPQPTIAELDAYAASPEYLAAWGAKRKKFCEGLVNAWANTKVMEFGILIDELFYTAMVANIGFLSTRWVRYGRPVDLDPFEFVCIHAEAQAYRDSHAGLGDVESQMSPFGLATVQEARWQDMQNGFAPIVYTRRLALEQIKLRPADETLPAALEALVASLDSILQQVSASLQQMQQAVLAARQAEVS